MIGPIGNLIMLPTSCMACLSPENHTYEFILMKSVNSAGQVPRLVTLHSGSRLDQATWLASLRHLKVTVTEITIILTRRARWNFEILSGPWKKSLKPPRELIVFEAQIHSWGDRDGLSRFSSPKREEVFKAIYPCRKSVHTNLPDKAENEVVLHLGDKLSISTLR